MTHLLAYGLLLFLFLIYVLIEIINSRVVPSEPYSLRQYGAMVIIGLLLIFIGRHLLVCIQEIQQDNQLEDSGKWVKG